MRNRHPNAFSQMSSRLEGEGEGRGLSSVLIAMKGPSPEYSLLNVYSPEETHPAHLRLSEAVGVESQNWDLRGSGFLFAPKWDVSLETVPKRDQRGRHSYRQSGASYPGSSEVRMLLSEKQPRMFARSFGIQPIIGPGSPQGPCSLVAKDAQRLLLGRNQISPHHRLQPPWRLGREQLSQAVVADRRKLEVSAEGSGVFPQVRSTHLWTDAALPFCLGFCFLKLAQSWICRLTHALDSMALGKPLLCSRIDSCCTEMQRTNKQDDLLTLNTFRTLGDVTQLIEYLPSLLEDLCLIPNMKTWVLFPTLHKQDVMVNAYKPRRGGPRSPKSFLTLGSG